MPRISAVVFVVLVGLGCSSDVATDAADPIAIGNRLVLRSDILDEDRSLLVYLPTSHDASSFRYPVFYALDGTSEFLHTVATVEFLARTDQIPEMIVVGIENTNRSRDLTPPSRNEDETAFWDETGGADDFLRFIREELIPFVDERFRTEPYRILRGQSFGGLLAVYDYLGVSPTFSAYLTSTASVGWNSGELLERAPGVLAAGPGRPIYVSAAGRDNQELVRNIETFVGLLGEHAASDVWTYDFFPLESHYSLSQMSTLNGLRWLYSDWQVPDSVAALADLTAIEQHYQRLSRDFGYSIKVPMKSVIRLGNNLLRQQRFEEGVAVHRANLEWYPDQPESYWHVGDALVLSGQEDEARPYFETAMEKAVALGVPTDEYRQSLEQQD